MKTFGLGKKEKLCSTRAIEELFGPGGAQFSTLAFPLRAVARAGAVRRSDSPVAFMISVPKKRLRHAVDRVAMRRRIREAYRLLKPSYPIPPDARIDLAFIYVADRLRSYRAVERAMHRILAALATFAQNPPSADESPQ